MKKKKVLVKKEVREKIDDPFDCELSLREIARRTGLDVGYLSRVKNGEIAVTEKNLARILAVTRVGSV